MLTVPPGLADSPIIRQAGALGRDWLRDLPAQADAFCQRWGLTPDGAPRHGALSLALPVRRQEERLVLRLSWPAMPVRDEVSALRAWAGCGAVLLLDADAPRHALLLERLDATRTLDDRPIAEAVHEAGRLLRQLSIPAPGGLPTLRDWARTFTDTLDERWRACGEPFSAALRDRARELAGALGQDPSRLLIHDDLHHRNVLAGTRAPWLAIDPMVRVGRPEVAVARLLWTRLEDILDGGGLEEHFGLLVDAAQLDASLARDWTLLRALDYWLWGLGVGLTIDPERCRVIVEWALQEAR